MPELHSLQVMHVPKPEYGMWVANAVGWCRPAEASDFDGPSAKKNA